MKNLLIITYWSYRDALIQTYTLPYVKLIRKNLNDDQKIYLITLEQASLKMNDDEWKNEKEKLLKDNIHLLKFNYTNFGFLMILKFPFIFLSLFILLLTKKINYIHTWCTPAGGIGYLLSLFSGKKLILDSFEPHAEPMIESKTWKKDSLKFKILFWLEKKQLQRATNVITCVDSMKQYVKNKFNFDLTNFYTKPACIDFDLFDINKSKNKELIKKYKLKNKIIGVYAGKFEGSYLKDEVFEFLQIAENYWGQDNFRFIILTNHSSLFVEEMIAKYKLNRNTVIQLFVPHQEVPKYMGLANFGISPFIPVPSKRYGSPIKNSEYMAMGLPIIITKDISDDSELIENSNIGYVLQGLTTHEYLKACQKINALIHDENLSNRIRSIALKYRNFEIANTAYKSIYGLEDYSEVIIPEKAKNILILTYWSYQDALIQTYTLPYVRIIQKNLNSKSKIYLFTLEQEFYKMNKIEWKLEKEHLLKENIHLIRFNYSNFGIKMVMRIGILLVYLYRLIKSCNITTIHAWCTPAGAIGYILAKITSSNLIIDSYEPHAESMIENGTWEKSSLKFKILFWLEKKQSQKAESVIALTKGMKSYALNKYNTDFKNFYIKPALVNLKKFNWNSNIYNTTRKEKELENKIVCVYAGKLGGIYLEEEVFDFFKIASDYWGDKFKVFLLTEKNMDEVNLIIKQKNIPANCIETHFVNHSEIQKYYQISDFAINFVKPVPSKKYCTSIKDGEYWAMGLPVVITRDISDDSTIIQDNNIGYVLKDLTNQEYENACDNIDTLLKDKENLRIKIKNIAINYRSYDIANQVYEKIYN